MSARYSWAPAGDYQASPYEQLEEYLRNNGISQPTPGAEEQEDLNSRYVFPYEEDLERSAYDCLSGIDAGAISAFK
jgi:hypothetical protein